MGDVVMLPMLVVGIMGAVWGAWALARRYGFWLGLVIPTLAVAGFALRAAMPLGHPEEAMGRGLEQMFLWLPLLVMTLAAAALGAVWRRRQG